MTGDCWALKAVAKRRSQHPAQKRQVAHEFSVRVGEIFSGFTGQNDIPRNIIVPGAEV